ncbi:hypothetical protein ACFFRR_003398 [Megaselia abdita]
MAMDLSALKKELQTLIREKTHLQQELEKCERQEKESTETCLKYKMKLFKTKEERDRTYDTLQNCKKQYNSLYDAYVVKTRRLMAIEEVFIKQKKLPGLISKEASVLMKRMQSNHGDEYNENHEDEIRRLRAQLEEAYNIIDELDFELESIDILEVENIKLSEELNLMKESQRLSANSQSDGNDEGEHSPKPVDTFKRNFSSRGVFERETADVDDDFYQMTDKLEVLPPREIKKAEMESQVLHREVLRSKIKQSRDSRDILKETSA